jgi:hypothetical protein
VALVLHKQVRRLQRFRQELFDCRYAVVGQGSTRLNGFTVTLP